MLFPGGFGFQGNPGFGCEFKISEKVYAGIDVRKFYIKISASDDQKKKYEDDHDKDGYHTYFERQFTYENSSFLAYLGMKF
jgi:hypothetical protein